MPLRFRRYIKNTAGQNCDKRSVVSLLSSNAKVFPSTQPSRTSREFSYSIILLKICRFREVFSSSVILSSSLEDTKTLLVDDLLAALVWSLGYEKALMKQTTETSSVVQFQLKRISQSSEDLSSTQPEKKKGKRPKQKQKMKKIPSSSSISVPESIAEGLREMRDHLENCFTSTNCLEPCRLFRDEAQSLPLKLEICSGFGEWAVKQVSRKFYSGGSSILSGCR
jgi:hypothetical protein